MNIEQSGNISDSLLSRIYQFQNLVLPARLEFWVASTYTTLLAGRIQAIVCAFSQHRALELCEDSYNLHHHSATGRGGVNHFGQTAETNPAWLIFSIKANTPFSERDNRSSFQTTIICSFLRCPSKRSFAFLHICFLQEDWWSEFEM